MYFLLPFLFFKVFVHIYIFLRLFIIFWSITFLSNKSRDAMPKEMAEITAKFCGTVNLIFDALASAYTQLYKMNWVPQQNWMYSGGDWTVMISGTRGVFVEKSKADLKKLFTALGIC